MQEMLILEPLNGCAHGESIPNVIDNIIGNLGIRHQNPRTGRHDTVQLSRPLFNGYTVKNLKELSAAFEAIQNHFYSGILNNNECRNQLVSLQFNVKYEVLNKINIGKIRIVEIRHRCLYAIEGQDMQGTDIVVLGEPGDLQQFIEICELIKHKVKNMHDLATNAAHILSSL